MDYFHRDVLGGERRGHHLQRLLDEQLPERGLRQLRQVLHQEGASAKFSFTGNSVTWWATRGTDREAGEVYVDGSFAGVVNLYSPTNQPRQALFTKSWPTSGNHTIKMVANEGMENVKADVDAFSVTQPK